MPSIRTPLPSGFGISTRRIGWGTYVSPRHPSPPRRRSPVGSDAFEGFHQVLTAQHLLQKTFRLRSGFFRSHRGRLTLPSLPLAGSARYPPGVLWLLSHPACVSFVRRGTRHPFSLPCSLPSPPCAAAPMPSADFCPPLPAPRSVGSQSRQTARSPRGWRTHLPPIHPSHLLPPLPDDYRALNLIAFSPRCGCLICASCSSGRGFASRFLQIPPRGGSPCGSANGSRHRGLWRTFTSQ